MNKDEDILIDRRKEIFSIKAKLSLGSERYGH